MANQRTTFGKRQREQNRKDKLRAKQERLAARRAAPAGEKGPPIDWSEAVGFGPPPGEADDASPASSNDDSSDGSS
jgi:hypothetical protein